MVAIVASEPHQCRQRLLPRIRRQSLLSPIRPFRRRRPGRSLHRRVQAATDRTHPAIRLQSSFRVSWDAQAARLICRLFFRNRPTLPPRQQCARPLLASLLPSRITRGTWPHPRSHSPRLVPRGRVSGSIAPCRPPLLTLTWHACTPSTPRTVRPSGPRSPPSTAPA